MRCQLWAVQGHGEVRVGRNTRKDMPLFMDKARFCLALKQEPNSDGQRGKGASFMKAEDRVGSARTTMRPDRITPQEEYTFWRIGEDKLAELNTRPDYE